MGTYCGNHAMEEIRKNCNQAKGGEVTVKRTKDGSCGHLGGCSLSPHEDLYELRYDYQPSEENVDAAKEAAEIQAEEKAKLEAEKEEAVKKTAAADSTEESTTATEKTTTEEKPVEEAPQTA